jgi:hypothetical protein
MPFPDPRTLFDRLKDDRAATDEVMRIVQEEVDACFETIRDRLNALDDGSLYPEDVTKIRDITKDVRTAFAHTLGTSVANTMFGPKKRGPSAWNIYYKQTFNETRHEMREA